MEQSIAHKLKTLREEKSISLQELADQVGVVKQSIHKFETGVLKPSSETLLKLSEAFHVSYSSFFDLTSTSDFSLKNIKFREGKKLADKSNFENEIQKEVFEYLRKFLELENSLGIKHEYENPVSDLAIMDQKDVERAAKLLRKKWKLGNGPISDVVETLETKGVFVVEVDKATAFTGLSAKFNEDIPIIVLNKNSPTERRRFTAIHELGHIVLNFIDNISEGKLEHLCNSFAGAVLLIDEMLQFELGKNRTAISLAELRRIKEQYGISVHAIIVRAHYAGLIDENTYKNWNVNYDEWKSKHNSSSYFGKSRLAEKPTRFRTLIQRGVAEKRLSVAKAAEITGQPIDSLREELSSDPKFSFA